MPSLPPEPASPSQAAPGMCIHHPDLRAAFVCSLCGQPICSLCAFTRTDGSRVCPRCASSPGARAESGPRLAGRGDLPPRQVHALKCVQHPNVSAVHVCRGCGAPMCATCEFVLPGDLRLCPRCVAAPPKRMSGKRKGLIIAAYVFAVWNTLGLAVLMSGLLRGLAASQGGAALIGLVFFCLLLIPSVVGAAIGFSCFDPRLRNPPSIWGAMIWNALLLLIYVALIAVGNLAHHT